MKYVYITELESVVRFGTDESDYYEVCPAANAMIGAAIAVVMTTLSANRTLAKYIYAELARIHNFTN